MDKSLQQAFMKLPRCACFNLRKTTRAFTQYYDRLLKPAGLRTTQFSILAVLKMKPGVPLTLLAEILVMDRTTLSRNLNPLARSGMISIQPGIDKRQRIAEVTQAGEKTLEKAIPLWDRAHERVIETLGEESFQSLLETLTSLIGEMVKY